MNRRRFFVDAASYIAAASAFVGSHGVDEVFSSDCSISPTTGSPTTRAPTCEEELRAIGFPSYCVCDNGELHCYTTTTTCDPSEVGSWCGGMEPDPLNGIVFPGTGDIARSRM